MQSLHLRFACVRGGISSAFPLLSLLVVGVTRLPVALPKVSVGILARSRRTSLSGHGRRRGR